MKLILGDSLEVLKELEDNSIDSIVTDPPYGLSFMGRKWDYDVPSQEIWEECLRVLKPGGYLLAFAGTRTQHRMAVRIEDAGFEIRDMIMYVYGSGFPKSHNIGKAVDKLQGNEREVVEERTMTQGGGNALQMRMGEKKEVEANITKGNSPYEGWGTALKPSLESITVAQKSIDFAPNLSPIIMSRKPISEKTVAENVLKYGTGGINIDGCRVGLDYTAQGRFPANLIHDGSDEVVGLFPDTGKGNNGIPYNYAGTEYNNKDTSMFNGDKPQAPSNFNDSGSASRFFQKCEFDNECFLCYNTLHRANINENICNNTNVSGVKKNLKTTQVIKENTVPLNVEDLQDDKLVQLVKSVENLCQKCEIDFVQNLVVISENQRALQSQEELQVIQDFITDYRKCILIQNLANYVEMMDNIDTTPTTTSLLKLFGSVQVAIKKYTQETKKSEQKRFLYCPKASKAERNKGCEELEFQTKIFRPGNGLGGQQIPAIKQNHHPTVKPISLMQYLVRLVTPKGGTVLDPFMGSGTTGIGAKLEGFDFIGIEREAEYIKIAEARINAWQKDNKLL